MAAARFIPDAWSTPLLADLRKSAAILAHFPPPKTSRWTRLKWRLYGRTLDRLHRHIHRNC